MASDKLKKDSATVGTVHVSRPAQGVVRLEMDNPPMNALGPQMCATMVDTFAAVDADPSVRVVILTGRGLIAAINGHCIGGGL